MARNLIASDDFNRADNADLGAAWDAYSGADNFRVNDNKAKINAVSNGQALETHNTAVANDQWAQVHVAFITTAVYTNAGVLCRMAAPNTQTGYAFLVQHDDAVIGKFTAGSFTSLASVPFSITSTPGITLTLECVLSDQEIEDGKKPDSVGRL